MNYEYVTIRVNTKFLIGCLVVLGLYWAKNYFYYKGAEAAFRYEAEQSKEQDTQQQSMHYVPPFRDDGEPAVIGKNYDLSC